jgi:toxin HigB-1
LCNLKRKKSASPGKGKILGVLFHSRGYSRCLHLPVDKGYATGCSLHVKIRNFVHKGLKRLHSEGSVKGVPPDAVDKLRKMFAYIDSMDDPEQLRSLAAWKVHMLTGDRKGTWSLSVTRNGRLTFRIDLAEQEICDVSLEDYH